MKNWPQGKAVKIKCTNFRQQGQEFRRERLSDPTQKCQNFIEKNDVYLT